MDYYQAKQEDFEWLVDVRIRAMKPSLERIGRFDPLRARERFQQSFIPEKTRIVEQKGRILGFYMATENHQEIRLNHLYIEPTAQGKGIGSDIIKALKSESTRVKKMITLEVLKESRANQFYLSHGFRKTGESEFDNMYIWKDF